MNRFIGSLAIVTTTSYHYYKIVITNDTMNNTDCLSLPLLNWRSYHESPSCGLDKDCIENTSSDVLLEAMFIFSCPATSYSDVFSIVARIRGYENVYRAAA
jgi:hypothetical protein